MRYAEPETVYRLLEIDPNTADPDVLQDLENLEQGIALAIDEATNRTFGTAAAQETRDLAYARDTSAWYYDRVVLDNGLIFFTDTLFRVDGGLPVPYVSPYGMRNVTAVAIDGTWNGTSWDDETTYTSDEWRLVFVRTDGWAHGIQTPRTDYGSLRVTAEWEDRSSSATVPADIREAATFILADEWRTRYSSPNGEIGPPGLTTYLRNVWEHPSVKLALQRNTFRQLVV